MDDDGHIEYAELIDEAMHYVVRRALMIAEDVGLSAEHHFFIAFLTEYPGVEVSEELRTKYTEEMTIVLQHQYWDVIVEEEDLQ